MSSPAVASRNAAWSARLRDVLESARRSSSVSNSKNATSKRNAYSTASLLNQYAFTDTHRRSLGQRITRLAAMNFAAGFSQRSIAVMPTSPPGLMREEVAADAAHTAELSCPFPTFRSALGVDCVQLLRHFALVSEFGGFTWLVVNHSSQKIEVVNTPQHVSPLTIGMTPLLAIDTTSEAVLNFTTPTASETPLSPPRWARAARNPSVCVSSEHVVHQRSTHSLPEQRVLAVDDALGRLNWEFAETQYNIAMEWLTSSNRREARAERQERLKKKLLDAIPRHREVVDSDDTEISASDSVARTEITTETTHAEPTVSGVKLSDGSTMYALPDGASEFRHADGTSVTVRADGTQMFFDASRVLTIIVHSDGTQEWPQQPGSDVLRTIHRPDGTYVYEYANRSIITLYADGRSVTQFEDGSIREVLPDESKES